MTGDNQASDDALVHHAERVVAAVDALADAVKSLKSDAARMMGVDHSGYAVVRPRTILQEVAGLLVDAGLSDLLEATPAKGDIAHASDFVVRWAQRAAVPRKAVRVRATKSGEAPAIPGMTFRNNGSIT